MQADKVSHLLIAHYSLFCAIFDNSTKKNNYLIAAILRIIEHVINLIE